MTAHIASIDVDRMLRERSTRALFPAIPWAGRSAAPPPAPRRPLNNARVGAREAFERISWTESTHSRTGPTEAQQHKSVKSMFGAFPWE